MHKKILVLSIAFISSIVLLTGCLFEGEQSLEEMDTPPESVETVNNLDNVGEDVVEGEGSVEGEEDSDSSEPKEVKRELYLLDKNGMVVPQTLTIPTDESKAVAKQTLEYLVKDGPVTNMLPNGFQAVLPVGTEVNSMNLEEDGTLIVDLSEEFTNYTEKEELQILQAMTFTLTQFDTVERVKLRIEGQEQDVMPVNGTPISNGLSRANGINLHVGDVTDLTNSTATTLYYPAQHDGQYYFVPVTVPIESEEADMYESVVKNIINGPGYEMAGLLNVFQEGVELTAEPVYKDGVLSLTFNDAIFNSIENQTISNEVLSSLVLSLTEQPGVEAVQVTVDGTDQVFNENGETFSKPVSRDDVINASGI
ncbi:germination protein M [Salirhabdus euzebyi]|uniref:Germination protein M n=1 Tax=Salirhabdus euzebyi TaxID=394506 RepID=A0A841PX86_9BACI|nr:GerMN domain-containing protein [Salirhabdus euzebyi]MBB6452026.1 germination protein M [Salirhabdus euzebyi]